MRRAVVVREPRYHRHAEESRHLQERNECGTAHGGTARDLLAEADDLHG